MVNAIGPGFVELYNREDTPRDLGGLALTDDLRDRLQTALPAGTVVPARGKVTLPFTPPPTAASWASSTPRRDAARRRLLRTAGREDVREGPRWRRRPGRLELALSPRRNPFPGSGV